MSLYNDCIILFVEGETEREFYSALLQYYNEKCSPRTTKYRVFNVKGISRFEAKVAGKIRYEVLPKHSSTNIKVFCCYDTDVFELARKPPTNWAIVKKRVEELGITAFYEIKAIRMIEDWFLKDPQGICNFLKIPIPKRIEGKNGLQKIKFLFKKGNSPKNYLKGAYTHKFIPYLDFSKLRNELRHELAHLELTLQLKKTKRR